MDTVGAVIEKKARSAWTLAVAAQIRAERAARGLTQQNVMDQAGFAKSTYLRMESGERVVDSDQIAQLCAAYGMRVSTFYARVEERVEEGRKGALAQLTPAQRDELSERLAADLNDPEVDAARAAFFAEQERKKRSR